ERAPTHRGRPSPPSGSQIQASLFALGAVLRGAFALFLRRLLRTLGTLRGHALLFLVHALALHRAVACDVARRLLPAAEQLVEPTHRGLLAVCNGQYLKWPQKKPDPVGLAALRI